MNLAMIMISFFDLTSAMLFFNSYESI